jgi:hypothetical protein
MRVTPAGIAAIVHAPPVVFSIVIVIALYFVFNFSDV